MAFKASTIVPADAYQTVKRAAVQLKINLQGFVSQSESESVDYEFLQGVYLTLTRANNQFNTLKATAGLAAYAQEQENDPAYDVAAEFTAMQAAITGATAWLDANILTNVTAKLPSAWDGGVIISDTFSPAQTAGLRTQLNSVITAID